MSAVELKPGGAAAKGLRRAALPALALLLAAIALAPGPALGERAQKGNVVVSIRAGVSPLRLPRDRPAPVTLRVGGQIATTDRSALPRLHQIRLTLAGRGLLYTRGLPRCPRARIANADNRQALERCGAALVGRGALRAKLFVPHQEPFAIQTSLLAFNGQSAAGRPAVWVHAFAGNPPISIVLPFLIQRQARTLRTTLIATVPPALGELPHLASFQLELGRRFRYQGRQRSYLSASCPAPRGFNAGFLTFAKATYSFADGRQIRTDAVRSCRAR